MSLISGLAWSAGPWPEPVSAAGDVPVTPEAWTPLERPDPADPLAAAAAPPSPAAGPESPPPERSALVAPLTW